MFNPYPLASCRGGRGIKRLRTKRFGEGGFEYCTSYKTRLLDYLAAYIDTVRTREICAALLKSVLAKTDQKEYGIISSAPRKDRPPLTASDTAM